MPDAVPVLYEVEEKKKRGFVSSTQKGRNAPLCIAKQAMFSKLRPARIRPIFFKNFVRLILLFCLANNPAFGVNLRQQQ